MAGKVTKPAAGATIHASLPRPLRTWVERRVRDGGFGNVSEYIRLLIRRDQQDPRSVDPALLEPALLEPALPGIGGRTSGSYPDGVRENSAAALSGTAASTDYPAGNPADPKGIVEVDFDRATWRELRAAVVRGDRQLMTLRMAEATGLLRGALEMRRAMLRQEHPTASTADIETRLASWLFERGAAEPTDATSRESSRERIQRLGSAPAGKPTGKPTRKP